MNGPLDLVLASTLAASTRAIPLVLETAAHGTVSTRALPNRRELVRDRLNGEAPMLDAETLATIEEAAAPGVEIGDMVHAGGKLWQVRSPLAVAGTVTLQLTAAQRADLTVDGEEVTAYVVGDPGRTAPVVALANAGVLRRSDLVELDGYAYRVGTPTVWPAGDLRRYALTPA